MYSTLVGWPYRQGKWMLGYMQSVFFLFLLRSIVYGCLLSRISWYSTCLMIVLIYYMFRYSYEVIFAWTMTKYIIFIYISCHYVYIEISVLQAVSCLGLFCAVDHFDLGHFLHWPLCDLGHFVHGPYWAWTVLWWVISSIRHFVMGCVVCASFHMVTLKTAKFDLVMSTIPRGLASQCPFWNDCSKIV